MRYDVEILCEGNKLTVHGIEAKSEKDAKIEARKMYIVRLCTSTSLPPNAFNSLFNEIIVNNVNNIHYHVLTQHSIHHYSSNQVE